MVRLYADRIERGLYDYNSTALAYVRIKDKITEQMRADVIAGRNEMTAQKFEDITGKPFVEEA